MHALNGLAPGSTASISAYIYSTLYSTVLTGCILPLCRIRSTAIGADTSTAAGESKGMNPTSLRQPARDVFTRGCFQTLDTYRSSSSPMMLFPSLQVQHVCMYVWMSVCCASFCRNPNPTVPHSTTQAELTKVLGQYMDIGMNFVSGAPLNERNRVEVLIDDQGLYREKQVLCMSSCISNCRNMRA